MNPRSSFSASFRMQPKFKAIKWVSKNEIKTSFVPNSNAVLAARTKSSSSTNYTTSTFPEPPSWPRNVTQLSWNNKPKFTDSTSAKQETKPLKSLHRNVTVTHTSSAKNKLKLFQRTLHNTKENKDPSALLSNKEIQAELNNIQTKTDKSTMGLKNFINNLKKKHRLPVALEIVLVNLMTSLWFC